MKFITRLNHNDKEMSDAIFGWDIFRCRDYGNMDGIVDKPIEVSELRKLKPIFGYTVILACNLKAVKFFKRLFLRTI